MFSSFSSRFSFGRSAVVAATVSKIVATTPGTSTPSFGSSGATWTSTTDNAPVNAGWTLLVSNNADDTFTSINIPFSFYIYGSSGSTLYPGSNTYITIGAGSPSYSGLSLGPTPNPPLAGIHLGSADNSWQRVWYKNIGTTGISIRYEGTSSWSGTPGLPNVVYEATFYKSDGTNQYIQLKIGNHSRATGVFGITNGQTISNSFLNFGAIATNTNYVITTDANGNNPSIVTGTYTP